ncbi:hypothetical protein C8J56DRAFT_986976 [Mycena floridula]|nr:hypothetical protein C8J56DRAFT_986976 [Mycena floridula]
MPKDPRQPRYGTFIPSPTKRRNVHLTQTFTARTSKNLRVRKAQDLLDALDMEADASSGSEEEDVDELSDDLAMVDDEKDLDFGEPAPIIPIPPETISPAAVAPENSQNTANAAPRKPRRTEPDDETIEHYARWQDLLDHAVDPYLAFSTAIHAQTTPINPNPRSMCTRSTCQMQQAKVQCHYLDTVQSHIIMYCKCQSLPQVLIQHGLFPSAPITPRLAFSITLLDLFQALFERSCDAVNAMAGAMQNYYERRGFPFVTNKGGLMLDPIRQPLGCAIQWYDLLRQRVSKVTDDAVDAAAQFIEDQRSTIETETFPSIETIDFPMAPPTTAQHVPIPSAASPPVSPEKLKPKKPKPKPKSKFKSKSYQPPPSTDEASAEQAKPGLTPGQCHRILRDLCPACFGGTMFGRTFDEGADIHVSTDGNFHHKHDKSAGDTPPFYNPERFVSKAFVDEIGRKIEIARGKAPKPRAAKLPDEAINACEDAHQAAKGERKRPCDKFDDTGIMSLICRHDIPILMANIDTPGEQQKYMVAMVIKLCEMLPPQATLGVLYDLGCIVDRSSEIYDIFPDWIASRLVFATTAMHAYAHQWACQLVFNPRLKVGFCMTDGEGVERIWSASRGLIPLTRHCSRSRRIWMLDRLYRYLADAHRDSLGEWIQRRLKKLTGLIRNHKEVLQEIDIPETELREQWQLQKAEQTSIRAYAPTRIKKELDVVLKLQAEIDHIDGAIQTVAATLKKNPSARDSLDEFRSLQEIHAALKAKADELYRSLNIGDQFPDLRGLDITFIRALLMARDLKITIRKESIGSFCAIKRLDQASGGVHRPLGTTKHQIARQGMAKRAPALLNLLKKFNLQCDILEQQIRPGQKIPVPKRLPTDLTSLQACTHLMEDVWISQNPSEQPPRWLEDADLRRAIRARLDLDRCYEEQRRLGIEADNMCRWFGAKLAALEVAIRCPKFVSVRLCLTQRRDHLLFLRRRWSNQLASLARYESHAKQAIVLAERLTNIPQPVIWNTPWVSDGPSDGDYNMQESDEELEKADGEIEAVPISIDQLYLAALLEEDEEEEITETPVEAAIDAGARPAAAVARMQQSTNRPPEHDLAPTRAQYKFDIRISLDPPTLLHHDTVAHHMLEFAASMFPYQGPPNIGRQFHGSPTRGLARVDITSDELSRFSSGSSSASWLNDTCMQIGASVLFEHFVPDMRQQRVALLSSYLLAQFLLSTSPEAIWRTAMPSLFWQRRVWLLPVHRKATKHWVLYVVYLQSGELHMFDSFGESRHMADEAQIVMSLVHLLINQANKHGYPLVVPLEGWTASPLVTNAVQTNSVDCGIWVLCSMVPVMRGMHVLTGLHERQIPNIRECILKGIRNLPASI